MKKQEFKQAFKDKCRYSITEKEIDDVYNVYLSTALRNKKLLKRLSEVYGENFDVLMSHHDNFNDFMFNHALEQSVAIFEIGSKAYNKKAPLNMLDFLSKFKTTFPSAAKKIRIAHVIDSTRNTIEAGYQFYNDKNDNQNNDAVQKLTSGDDRTQRDNFEFGLN